jgi:phosphoglycolate phosphatase
MEDIAASPTFVVFDLDGTLADSAEGIVRSFHLTLAELDRSAADEDLRRLIGPPLSESFTRLGLPANEVHDAVERYRAHYDRIGVELSRPYDGVVEMVEAVAATGRRLGVATAKRVDFAERMLRNFGIRDRFEVVAGASLDGRLNSKLEVLDAALATLSTPAPAWGWMVGDRDFDMVAARRRGLRAVGVLWGYGSRDELDGAGADLLVDAPRDVAGLLSAARA